ncbi:MAG: hypothetical protein AAFN93_26670 [Bacteroidota bacterium]
MARIPENIVEQIYNAIDIVEVISDFQYSSGENVYRKTMNSLTYYEYGNDWREFCV